MGQFNSRLDDGVRSEDPDLPVMGGGYDPLYDAALVGDWTRLVDLCEHARDGEGSEDGGDGGDAGSGGEGAGKEDLDKESSLTSRITSLRVFDGGHDYSVDISFTSTTNQEGALSSSILQQTLVEGDGAEEGECDGGDASVGEAQPQTEKVEPDGDEEEEQPRGPFVPFADAKGNTPLHLACRRDPPLAAIRALLALHPPWAWSKTKDGWTPLHLACHCGCDVDVANALLAAMEDLLDEKRRDGNSLRTDGDEASCDDGEESNDAKDEGDTLDDGKEDDDPLLPRDERGRTPLHLACASSRNPRRRPDLVRLLLLRSKDPRGAALARDWVGMGRRVGVDLAMGELKVLVGGLDTNQDKDELVATDITENNGANSIDEANDVPSSDGNAAPSPEKIAAARSAGRTPLDLVEDDYREELEEALRPGFSIAKVIAACLGDETNADEVKENVVGGEDADGDAPSSISPETVEAMYESWAILGLLVLAAGTQGGTERVKQALGGAIEEQTDSSSPRKSVAEVIQDFQLIHGAACQIEACPSFRELAKKFLRGMIDRKSIGKVSDLKSQWESHTFGRVRSVGPPAPSNAPKKKKKIRPKLSPVAPTPAETEEEDPLFGDVAVSASSPPRRPVAKVVPAKV